MIMLIIIIMFVCMLLLMLAQRNFTIFTLINL